VGAFPFFWGSWPKGAGCERNAGSVKCGSRRRGFSQPFGSQTVYESNSELVDSSGELTNSLPGFCSEAKNYMNGGKN